MKIGWLFQVMFYNLHNGNKRTPLRVMNAVEIYERCKSRELITSFNRNGLCISYASMKRHCQVCYLSLICHFQVTSREAHLPSPHSVTLIIPIRTHCLVNQVPMSPLSLYSKKFLSRKK